MKRKTLLFFLIAALLAFAVQAADTVNVRLDDLGMSLDVPSDCSVFTRNMDPADPVLEKYGLDLEQTKQLLEERNIYLNLLNDDPAYEILVTMLPNVVENISVFDEQVLDSFTEPLRQEYESNGMTVNSIDRVANDQGIFFRTEGEIAGVKALIYYTVCNHQAISLVVRYAGDVMPEEYRTQLEDMVDSIRFDSVTAASAEELPETEAESDLEAAVEAAAEETAEEIDAAAEALEEDISPAESLISPSADADDAPAAPSKKKGFPVLPVVLGGVAVGAVAGLIVSRSKKKGNAPQQPAYSAQPPVYGAPIAPVKPGTPPTYAVPVAPTTPATNVPPTSAAAVAGAAAPITQAVTPAAPTVPAAPVAPPAAAVAPAGPTVAPAADIPVSQTSSASPVKRICTACGATLAQDEKFCPFCGTKAE